MELLSAPAFAVGVFLNVITTVSRDGEQGLFEIVHTKVQMACPLLAAGVNDVIEKVDVGLAALLNDPPAPPTTLTMLQLPVPIAGTLPAKVVERPQTV